VNPDNPCCDPIEKVAILVRFGDDGSGAVHYVYTFEGGSFDRTLAKQEIQRRHPGSIISHASHFGTIEKVVQPTWQVTK
jgi:hypothetical protein